MKVDRAGSPRVLDRNATTTVVSEGLTRYSIVRVLRVRELLQSAAELVSESLLSLCFPAIDLGCGALSCCLLDLLGMVLLRERVGASAVGSTR